MKKFTLFLVFCTSLLFSCKKENPFNYSPNHLHGTWDGTALYTDNQWFDITVAPWSGHLAFALELRTDGTCALSGYLGKGNGTYSTTGNTIHTSIEGDLSADYDIFVLSEHTIELRRRSGHLSAISNIKLKRR